MFESYIGSRMLGVTPKQIQKYEKGKNRISASRLQRIAEILNVPVSSLFPPSERTMGRSNDDQYDQLALMEFLEGAEFNKAVSQIKDDNVRRRVIALVRSIADNESDPFS